MSITYLHLLCLLLSVTKSQDLYINLQQQLDLSGTSSADLVDASLKHFIKATQLNSTHTQVIQLCSNGTNVTYMINEIMKKIVGHQDEICGFGFFAFIQQFTRNLLIYDKFLKIVDNTILPQASIVRDVKFSSVPNVLFYIQSDKTIYEYQIYGQTTNKKDLKAGYITTLLQVCDGMLVGYAVKDSTIAYMAKFDQGFSGKIEIDLAVYEPQLLSGILYRCCHHLRLVHQTFITYTYGSTIQIWDLNSQVLHSNILRPDLVYNSIYDGQYLYSIEREGALTMLRIIHITGLYVITELTLQLTSPELYQLDYILDNNTVIIYHPKQDQVNSIILTNTPMNITNTTQTDTQSNTESIINDQQKNQVIQSKKQQEVAPFVEDVMNNIFSEQSKQIMTTSEAGITISLSSQVLVGLVRPIFTIIEDFWFYRYHSKTYPIFVQKLTQQFSLFNQFRVRPAFMDSITLPNPQLQSVHQKYYERKYDIQGKDPLNQYFIAATKEVYLSNFIITTAIFLAMVLIRLLCKLLSCCFSIFQSIESFFAKKTTLISLSISLILPNTGIIAFSAGAQFIYMFSFTFQNKGNIITAVGCLFIWAIFCALVFIFLYLYSEKDQSQEMIQISKFSLKGFLIQFVVNSLRRLVQGFIHGVLIDSHMLQISSLVMMDIFMVIFCIKNRKGFKSQVIFVTCCLYFITFFGFDLMLLVYSMEVLPQLDYNLILLIIVLSLMLISVIKVLIILYYMIKQFFQQNILNNKVGDQQILQLQKKQNEKNIENKQDNKKNKYCQQQHKRRKHKNKSKKKRPKKQNQLYQQKQDNNKNKKKSKFRPNTQIRKMKKQTNVQSMEDQQYNSQKIVNSYFHKKQPLIITVVPVDDINNIDPQLLRKYGCLDEQ